MFDIRETLEQREETGAILLSLEETNMFLAMVDVLLTERVIQEKDYHFYYKNVPIVLAGKILLG